MTRGKDVTGGKDYGYNNNEAGGIQCDLIVKWEGVWKVALGPRPPPQGKEYVPLE